MKLKCCLLSIFFAAANSYAVSLCTKSEEVIFSFESKSKKILSICKGEKNAYLTYRFGRHENIELQFPKILDATSWGKFEFSGIRRAGGKENAGFGEYSLDFKRGDTGYTVFQGWNDEENTYSIGVTVSGKGKPITVNGTKKSQEGSLVLLEEESKYIPNAAEQK